MGEVATKAIRITITILSLVPENDNNCHIIHHLHKV